MKTLRHAVLDYLRRKALAGGYSWNINKISLLIEALTYLLMPAPPLITYLITKSLFLSLILVLIPALPILLTLIWAMYAVDAVRENVEWELPFFIVLLDIVHDVGGDITHAFELSGKVGLKWIGREWSLIKRYALTTNSITRAMQLRARLHPSIEFQRFINGYVSVWGYSGDVSNYVRSVEGTYLSTLSNKLSSLSKQIIDIVVAIVSSLIVLILFVIITTILGMNYAILYIMPAVALLLPAIIMRVYQSIPYIIRIDLTHDRNTYMALGTSIIITVTSMAYLGLKGMMLLMLPPLIFSILVTRRINDMKNSIMALPDLARDVSEIVKAGVSMGAAFERVLDNPYPRPLITYLQRMNQLNDNVKVDGPWIIKFTIGILKELSNLGSPSKALDRLVEVLLELKSIITSISYGSRSLQLLNYALPIIFAGVTYMGRFVISAIGSILKNAPYALVGLSIPSINTVLMPLLLTAYIISLSVSLLTSLLSNLTINPTIRYALPIPLTLALMFMAVEIPVLA
ncbi:type II secretion system F family protein [Vulcanisaeta distributa]|uniref:type II secretion system F family protein n=1 Tax=Vulcanisaeta distributa TaxID=164451 RepID=UPI000B2D1D80|nr:type II secretion system F family protein [Vulcanisaeta distributa]